MINNLECTVSVRSIYGTTDLIAPEGYEFTGEFRYPQEGDTILSIVCGGGPFHMVVKDSIFHTPRLILRKKPKTYTDTEMLDFFIENAHKYMLGYTWSSIYNILGGVTKDTRATEITRETIMKVMRERGV